MRFLKLTWFLAPLVTLSAGADTPPDHQGYADELPFAAATEKLSDSQTLAHKVGGTYLGEIKNFRPTQMSVGMREVDDKLHKIQKLKGDKLEDYLKDHAIPGVVGFDGKLYIIDHHHVAVALLKAGITKGYYTVTADDSKLDEAAFWKQMQAKHWVYPYDQNGQGPHPVADLPKSVLDLRDDPYRSLAAAVRDDGEYDKTSKPFAEFLWADYFRSRIEIGQSDAAFDAAVKKAEAIAHDPAAASLPGYTKK